MNPVVYLFLVTVFHNQATFASNGDDIPQRCLMKQKQHFSVCRMYRWCLLAELSQGRMPTYLYLLAAYLHQCSQTLAYLRDYDVVDFRKRRVFFFFSFVTELVLLVPHSVLGGMWHEPPSWTGSSFFSYDHRVWKEISSATEILRLFRALPQRKDDHHQ